MKRVNIAVARLSFEGRYYGPPAPHLLRGAIASQFPNQPIFHQHTRDGLIYRYPMVQYRWAKTVGVIFAFGIGAKSLIKVPFLNTALRLGDKVYNVADVQLDFFTHTFSVSPRLNRYFFRSPWLPFNHENYSRYQNLSRTQQQTERDRLAVANILSALKGWDVFLVEHLYAGFVFKQSRVCRYKDTSLFGLQGTLLTNVDLPSGFGIGKAVSHGYGWMERANAVT